MREKSMIWDEDTLTKYNKAINEYRNRIRRNDMGDYTPDELAAAAKSNRETEEPVTEAPAPAPEPVVEPETEPEVAEPVVEDEAPKAE